MPSAAIAERRQSSAGTVGQTAAVLSRSDAEALDAADPLAPWRAEFVIADPDLVYLDGNSLGRSSPARLLVEAVHAVMVGEWATGLIRSWDDGWLDLPKRAGAALAPLLGADGDEVIVHDSTSVNLFQLVHVALALRPDRRVIAVHLTDFPTDRLRGGRDRGTHGSRRPVGFRPAGRRGRGGPHAGRLPHGRHRRPGGGDGPGDGRRGVGRLGSVPCRRPAWSWTSTAPAMDLAVGCTYSTWSGPSGPPSPMSPEACSGHRPADLGLVRPGRPVRNGHGVCTDAGHRSPAHRYSRDHRGGRGQGRHRGRGRGRDRRHSSQGNGPDRVGAGSGARHGPRAPTPRDPHGGEAASRCAAPRPVAWSTT